MNDEKLVELMQRRKNSLQKLRNKRAVVFAAFDIYKTNVLYGIEIESEEKRSEIVAWYQRCLDLNKDSIKNPPIEVKRYIKEK